MRRLLALAGVAALVLGIGTAAHAQINDDPTTSGTTGLFMVPRASTVEQGTWMLGASYSQFMREEANSSIRTLGFAGAYGLSHQRVTSAADLSLALADSLASAGTQVIEVAVDRRANLALHREIQREVSRCLRIGGAA